MLAKRIIPCLDVSDGRVVKGINFVELRDAGNPVELASAYCEAGADELVFLDISATLQDRSTTVDWVERVAAGVSIPLTVGGGIKNADDIRTILRSGADKVSINTAAVQNPSLICRSSQKFGSQCIVVAIDAKRVNSNRQRVWDVRTHGGSESAGLDALRWAEKTVELGAGELLVTSVDRDGTQDGYDLELLEALNKRVSVPVIASGGAGGPDHMLAAFEAGADAVLAASIFHYGRYEIQQVKEYLAKRGVVVRQ